MVKDKPAKPVKAAKPAKPAKPAKVNKVNKKRKREVEPLKNDLFQRLLTTTTDKFTRNLPTGVAWTQPEAFVGALSQHTSMLAQINGYLSNTSAEVPASERSVSDLIHAHEKRQRRTAVNEFQGLKTFANGNAAVKPAVHPSGVLSNHKFHPPVRAAAKKPESEAQRRVRLALERASAQLESARTLREVQIRTDTCDACAAPLVSMTREAAFVCPNCGPSVRDHGLTAPVPTLFDAHEQQRHSSERRKNTSLLFAQFQAGVTVPHAVMVRLRQQLAKLHVNSHKEIRVTLVKELLDLSGDRAYKQYAHRIVLQLIEAPMPSFTKQEVELILKLYDFLQFPLLRFEGPFPNSKLVARVCCATLGLHEMKGCFPLLKDANALRRQDQLLASMFAKIGVPFCPSI